MSYLIKDMYNFIASESGFPEYNDSIANSTTVKYILSRLNKGFEKVISDLSTSTGSLQRRRKYTTVNNISEYLADGIIQYVKIDGSKLSLTTYEDARKVLGKPNSYYILDGKLNLDPIPDGEYELTIVTSTKNIILSDNDTPKNYIDNINDEILVTDDLAKVIMYASLGVVENDFKMDSTITTGIYQSLLGYALESEIKANESPRMRYNTTRNYDLLSED